MYLSALKIFCDVVRLKSFSQAAEISGITQSAASQHVLQLEKSLGVKLLDRSSRPFQLTPEGKVYFQGCKTLVDRYFAVETEVKNLRKEITGTIKVAAIYSVGLANMSRYIQQFSRKYPRTNVTLSYLHPNRVYEAVLVEEADIGLISCPEKRHGLTNLPWKDQQMSVVCSPGHPFANRSRVEPKHLEDQNFISFDEGLAIQKEIARYLRKQQVEVNVKMAFDNIEGIKRAVEIGEGISILPEETVTSEVQAKTLISIPLVNPKIYRTLAIIHRENRTLLTATQRFIEFIQFKGKEANVANL